MIRTSDKIFIPFMALGLEEDAPPDMGGEAMHFSPPGGRETPGVDDLFSSL